MPQLTDEQKTALEQQTAKLLQQLEDFFDDQEGDYKSFSDRLKAIEGVLGKSEDGSIGANMLDRKSIEDNFERLKAGSERIERAIQHSRRGAYFPGLEDEAKRFSVVKVLSAVKKRDWTDAEHEKELCQKALEIHLEQLHSKADGQVGSDLERGGAFIPDQLIPDVIGPIYTKSAFIALDGDGETRVSVLDGLPGGRITVPQFHGGMIAYWMGEEDAYVESTAKTGDVHMDMKKIGVYARLTDTMIRFASYGFDNLLRRDMIKALVKKIDHTIPFGLGTANMPRGITHWATGGHKEAGTDEAGNATGPGVKVWNCTADTPLTYAAAQALSDGAGFASGEFDFDSIALMKLMFEEDSIDTSSSSFALIAPPRFFDRLKRIKIENYSSQTSGQPYLIGVPTLPDSRIRDLIGPFSRMNQIRTNKAPGACGGDTAVFQPASADTLHSGAFMGDFSEMIFGRGSGIEITDDAGKGVGFPTDSTYMKLRMYADHIIRDPRAIGFCPNVKVRDA